MLSVTENKRIIPAIHKVGNHPVSVADNILLQSLLAPLCCTEMDFTLSQHSKGMVLGQWILHI